MRVKNIQNTENKKEEIMQQAFLLMSKKGIKEISMSEIAQACGVTKPVLYYYFKDKEDLCVQLISSKLEKSDKALAEYLQKEDSFEKILIFIFSDYVHVLGERNVQADFFLHMHSYAGANPRFHKKMHNFRKESFVIFKAILEDQYKRGHILAKAKNMGLHFILANIAHLVMHRECADVKFGPDFAKDMAQMVLSALQYKGETHK